MTKEMKQQDATETLTAEIEQEQPLLDVPEQKKQDPDKKAAVQSYMKDKVLGQFTKQEIDVLQNTIAKGTNKEEFRLFVQTCVSAGLNPFLNHVFPIVYDGKRGRTLNIQISVEGVLHLARKVPGFKGVEVQLIHENDEFKAALKDGFMSIAQHEIGFPRGQVIGCYAIARREGFPDVIVLMEAGEVAKLKSGRNAAMWNDWFNDMFRKHVLKRAAKEQYGIEVSEEDIITGASEDAPKEQSGKDIIQTGEDEQVTTKEVKENLWSAIYAKTDEKRMNPDDLQGIIFDKFPGKKREELNPQQLSALLKFVEFFRKDDPQPKQSESVDMDFEEVNEGGTADEDDIFD